MAASVTPTLNDIFTAVRSFILGVVGQEVEVVRGIDNRVSMPKGQFINMTALSQHRLSTNIDTDVDPYIDEGFTFEGDAEAVGNVMTVSQVASGALHIGDLIGGANVPWNTTIRAFQSGSGGLGTYLLSSSMGFSSTAITVTNGSTRSMMPTRLHIQLDAYGPSSSDWSIMLATLLRDEYGCQALSPTCQPLYVDDPKMIPLITGEEQYLERWTLTAVVEYSPVTATGQQFAASLDVELLNVDVNYPP